MKKKCSKTAIPLLLILVVFIGWKNKSPKLFLIGDSISIQYGPFLEKFLDSFIAFERKQDDGEAEKNLDVPTGANGGDSGMVLAYLKSRVKKGDFHPDYLLLNCGLHDIKRNVETAAIQVEKEQYQKNLRAIFELMDKEGIQIIWMRTTQVVDSIHNKREGMSFHRYAADLEEYNKIADELCESKKVAVIDLYTFTKQLGNQAFIDHVHYNEKTRELQASYITGALKSILKE